MSKRPHNNGDGPPTKRHRDHYHSSTRRDDRKDDRYDRRDSYSKDRDRSDRHDDRRRTSHGDSPSSSKKKDSYRPPPKSEPETLRETLLPSPLPDLPPLSAEFADIPFRHKSTSVKSDAETYDQFEFMGDADIEHMASTIIFQNYRKQLKAGEMSQLRELLVKNETLAEFSRAYGLHKKIKAQDMSSMSRDSHGKGNKGLTKIIADVFEAYVCAAVLSDPDWFTGYTAVSEWLKALWAPRIEWAITENKVHSSRRQEKPLAERYDDTAKATLQKRIQRSATVRLNYKDGGTKELKGDKLGLNEWTVDLYLNAPEYGIEDKYLATGKGRNKAEAGNWCAVQAMYGKNKAFIDDLEKRISDAVAEHRRKKQEDALKRIEQASKQEVKAEADDEPGVAIKEEVKDEAPDEGGLAIKTEIKEEEAA